MSEAYDLNKDLAQYLLPDRILDYFEIVKDEIQNKRVHFYLEESYMLSEEYQLEKLQSKSFSHEITVEDFPLRSK